MTDTDLRELLQDHLTRLEPPLNISADEIARTGRSRRVRAAAVGVAVVAVAAVAGSAAVVVLNDPEQQSPIAADPGASLDMRIDEVARQVFAAQVGTLPEPTFSVTDSANETVPLDDPDLAGVGALYELPGGHDLALGVNAGGTNGMQELCDVWAPPRTPVDCEVHTLADGSKVMTAVLAFGPPTAGSNGLRTLLTAGERAAADPASLTWSRGVTVLAGDGDASGAYELLPAPSYAAARSAWQVPTDALIAASTDPTLTGYDFE